MPIYVNSSEKTAITDILEEMENYYKGSLEQEHLIAVVALEARRYGIKSSISSPFARQLIGTGQR